MIAQAWASWYEDHLEQKRLKHLTTRALAMWRNRALAMAWGSWHAQHLEQKRIKHLTTRALAMWRNRAMAMTMGKWWEEVLRTRKAAKAALMWMNRAMGKAWNAWQVMVMEKKRLRVIAQKVVGHWKNRVSTFTFMGGLVGMKGAEGYSDYGCTCAGDSSGLGELVCGPPGAEAAQASHD